ncbi:LysR substrate-binding domain-containing protein [Ottowia thiooxydans]|uniref:LysR family carnitine catabolism transcriptional activator n=1 Tax=Ottowia thiooxydans TaxID=219182 RepID=A0ABV2QBE4_9BURK
MRPKLTFSELEAVVYLGETRNFRLAASQAHITQSALSRRIQSAEAKLDARLFDRNTHSVEVTQAGLELLPIAEKMIAEFQDSLSDLSAFIAGRRGTIKISALASTAASILPPAIKELHASHPGVRVSIDTASADQIAGAVAGGNVDFGISIAASPKFRDLHFQELVSDEFLLVCSSEDPLARKRSVDWSVFLERPFIASGPESSVRMITERIFSDSGYAVRPTYESPNVALIGVMIANGVGIAALPRLAFPLLNTERVRTVPLRSPVATRRIGLLTRRGRTLPKATNVFLNLLIELNRP